MNHSRIYVACFLVMVFYSSVAAFDIQQGIHGMQWGSSIAGYDDLAPVKELDKASYYTKSNMLYETMKLPINRFPPFIMAFTRTNFSPYSLLNQDLLESAAPDAGDMPPSTNDQSLKSTPLIEY